MKLLNTLAGIVLAAAAPVGPPSLDVMQNEFKENLVSVRGLCESFESVTGAGLIRLDRV